MTTKGYRSRKPSPLQKANQWRWGVKGRIEGCCVQLQNIAKELQILDMNKDIKSIHDLLLFELEKAYNLKKLSEVDQ